MKLINLQDFWEVNNLKFPSFKKGLAWTKRHIDTSTVRRISAENYLIDSIIATRSYREYLAKQEDIYKDRVDRAKNMTKARQDKKKSN
jgi:hypothetical protein